MSSSEKEFAAEAEEILDEASRLLLDLSDSPGDYDPDLINGTFRAMHTLKGMSGLFGFQALADLSHELEEILDMLRLGKVEVSTDLIEFLLKYTDILRSLVDGIRNRKRPDTDTVEGYLSEIEQFMDRVKGGDEGGLDNDLDVGGDFLAVLSEYEEHRLQTNIKNGKGVFLLSMVFTLDDFDTHLKELTTKIKPIGELISTMPMSEGIPPGSIGFKLVVGSEKSAEDLTEKLGYEAVSLLKKKPAPAVKAPAKEAAPAAALDMRSARPTAPTVRVDIEKLDRILNTLGELTLVKNNARKLWASMSEIYGRNAILLDFYKLTQEFERRVLELQDNVLEIRMVPVSQIFSRLGQIIRRYSKSAKKQINLQLFGEDTEIDKSIAEEIVDPLMHIVRNAIDHGIEPEVVRQAAGKPVAGNVQIKALQLGNSVVIEVSDDGGGIDLDRIRAKAVQKGIIEKSSALDEHDIYDLMFAPGFSTKEGVSETSGRGVGLDVVKQQMSMLGGFVEVRSRLGQGTTFVLTLPITLAIVKALLVRVGRDTFAIALSAMNETLTIWEDDIKQFESGEAYNYRGDVLPITRMGPFLEIPEDGIGRYFGVVLGHGDRRIIVLVDELVGQQEVVIKPMSDYFDGLKVFGGATEVGNNEVILVLDVDAIIGEVLDIKSIVRT